MRKPVRKVFKYFAFTLLALVLLFAASFLPVLNLNTGNMSTLQGEWITVYYEAEEKAARDVFDLADKKAGQLQEMLGFSEKQNINLYIYDDQTRFQTKKYGLIAPLLGLDWYIGDNRGSTVLLASPGGVTNNAAYDRRCQAALHEMVHAYNSLLNPKMPLWLNEGTALYLTNGDPMKDLYSRSPMPTMQEMKTSNPIAFSNMGGYDFSHTYIEYLDITYGWEKVLSLLHGDSCLTALGKDETAIYQEWTAFLQTHYATARF